jgi:hypothetical protein
MTTSNTTSAVEALIEKCRRAYRAAEMSAGIMRDSRRTGGWEGSERTADAFDRIADHAREAHTIAAQLASLDQGDGHASDCAPFAEGGIGSRLLNAATDYAEEYVYDDGESFADHTPTEFERFMLIDFVNGLFSNDQFSQLMTPLMAKVSAPLPAPAWSDRELNDAWHRALNLWKAQQLPEWEKDAVRCARAFLAALASLGASLNATPPATVEGDRFFIDHGMIHDRVTGKHVTTDEDSVFEDGINACCALLNSLSTPSAQGHVEPDRKATSRDIVGSLILALDYIASAIEYKVRGLSANANDRLEQARAKVLFAMNAARMLSPPAQGHGAGAGWPDLFDFITPAVIDAGAQRLVSFEDNSVWPDSWDSSQVAQARSLAERCIRSALGVIEHEMPKPERPDLERIAKSIAEMITEYVDGGIASNQNWRNGLDAIIERRLQQLFSAPDAAPVQTETVGREEIVSILRELKSGRWTMDQAADALLSPAAKDN